MRKLTHEGHDDVLLIHVVMDLKGFGSGFTHKGGLEYSRKPGTILPLTATNLGKYYFCTEKLFFNEGAQTQCHTGMINFVPLHHSAYFCEIQKNTPKAKR